MSTKTLLLLHICGLTVIALLPLSLAFPNTDTNEVDDGPEYTMIQGVKAYFTDRECALVGGLCVHTSDCLEGTTNKGLCPSNAYRNVECCYELPLRPAPCVQHQGECMDRCHESLVRPDTDCQNGQVCCVLI